MKRKKHCVIRATTPILHPYTSSHKLKKRNGAIIVYLNEVGAVIEPVLVVAVNESLVYPADSTLILAVPLVDPAFLLSLKLAVFEAILISTSTSFPE